MRKARGADDRLDRSTDPSFDLSISSPLALRSGSTLATSFYYPYESSKTKRPTSFKNTHRTKLVISSSMERFLLLPRSTRSKLEKTKVGMYNSRKTRVKKRMRIWMTSRLRIPFL